MLKKKPTPILSHYAGYLSQATTIISKNLNQNNKDKPINKDMPIKRIIPMNVSIKLENFMSLMLENDLYPKVKTIQTRLRQESST